ncbi:hypothetical protein [Desulforamulus profundi]|uniref:hypothetical protein n=1 Tax=Desulforamulus profundi TaxID=1383067 RepID=UPI001EE55209|nr:hypothetical protein [Desulforamulus profundi]
MSRNVPDVLPGTAYELTFWARSIEVPRDPCDFTLVAQILYLDAAGNPTGTVQQTITSQQLNDTYRQFRVNGTPVPEAPSPPPSALSLHPSPGIPALH